MKSIRSPHLFGLWMAFGALLISAPFLGVVHPLPYGAESTAAALGLAGNLDYAGALAHQLSNPQLDGLDTLNVYHPQYPAYGFLLTLVGWVSGWFVDTAQGVAVLQVMTILNAGLWLVCLVFIAQGLGVKLRPSKTYSADRRFKGAVILALCAALASLPGLVRAIFEAGPVPLALVTGLLFKRSIDLYITRRKEQHYGQLVPEKHVPPSKAKKRASRPFIPLLIYGTLAGLAHPLNLLWCITLVSSPAGPLKGRLISGLAIGLAWLGFRLFGGAISGVTTQLGLGPTLAFGLSLDTLAVHTEPQIFYFAAAVLEPPLIFGAAKAQLEAPGFWSVAFLTISALGLTAAGLWLWNTTARARRRSSPGGQPGQGLLWPSRRTLLGYGGSAQLGAVLIMALVFALAREETSFYTIGVLGLVGGLPRAYACLPAGRRPVLLAVIGLAAFVCVAWNVIHLTGFAQTLHSQSYYVQPVQNGGVFQAETDSQWSDLGRKLCRRERPLVILSEVAYLPSVLPDLQTIARQCPGKTVEVRGFPVGFSMPWFEFNPYTHHPPANGWSAYRQGWLDSLEPGIFHPGQEVGIAHYIEYVYRSAGQQFIQDTASLQQHSDAQVPDYLIYFRHRTAQVYVARKNLASQYFEFAQDELVLGHSWLGHLQNRLGYRLELVNGDALAPAIERWTSHIIRPVDELVEGLAYRDSVVNVFYAYRP